MDAVFPPVGPIAVALLPQHQLLRLSVHVQDHGEAAGILFLAIGLFQGALFLVPAQAGQHRRLVIVRQGRRRVQCPVLLAVLGLVLQPLNGGLRHILHHGVGQKEYCAHNPHTQGQQKQPAPPPPVFQWFLHGYLLPVGWSLSPAGQGAAWDRARRQAQDVRQGLPSQKGPVQPISSRGHPFSLPRERIFRRRFGQDSFLDKQCTIGTP